MKEEEIIEGNKLIAEFMGYEYIGGDVMHYPYLRKGDEIIAVHSDVCYHSSWDWLMPVVEKIESFWNPYSENNLYDEHIGSDFQISTRVVDIQTMGYKNGKYIQFAWNGGWDYRTSFKFQTAWQACIEFIKWYNSQKQEQESNR